VRCDVWRKAFCRLSHPLAGFALNGLRRRRAAPTSSGKAPGGAPGAAPPLPATRRSACALRRSVNSSGRGGKRLGIVTAHCDVGVARRLRWVVKSIGR
jgi:hypothetical protein